MSDHINSIIQLYRVWVLYLYSKIIQSEYCIYWIQYSDWLFFALLLHFLLVLQNHPIRTLHILDAVSWLTVSSTMYSGTCLIRHTKGPGKCVGLYRMSEYSDFILVTGNKNTLGPQIVVGCHRMSENSGVRLHKFHCIRIKIWKSYDHQVRCFEQVRFFLYYMHVPVTK